MQTSDEAVAELSQYINDLREQNEKLKYNNQLLSEACAKLREELRAIQTATAKAFSEEETPQIVNHFAQPNQGVIMGDGNSVTMEF